MQHLLSFGVNKVGGQDAGLPDVRDAICSSWSRRAGFHNESAGSDLNNKVNC